MSFEIVPEPNLSVGLFQMRGGVHRERDRSAERERKSFRDGKSERQRKQRERRERRGDRDRVRQRCREIVRRRSE